MIIDEHKLIDLLSELNDNWFNESKKTNTPTDYFKGYADALKDVNIAIQKSLKLN